MIIKIKEGEKDEDLILRWKIWSQWFPQMHDKFIRLKFKYTRTYYEQLLASKINSIH